MSSGATSNQLSSIREVSLLIVLEIYLLPMPITIEFKNFVYYQIYPIVKEKQQHQRQQQQMSIKVNRSKKNSKRKFFLLKS